MGKNPCALALLVLALALSAATTSFAQGTTSRVTGVVTDNTGAAVAGATVTLTNEGTSSSVTTQTSESGSYTFDLIQPGTYTIAVEKQGFKRFISKQNAALVNQPTTINAALEIGDVSADVTVIGSAEQVQTSTSGNIGSTIDQRTLEALPIVGLRGRNPLDLLNYQPGIVSGANTGGGVHVNGSRDRSFNFTLDGIDINESTAGGSNFTPLRPNPDSIQEFQVVTSNFTAELGRSSGAQVTFVTRSGTNEFHGNLFEYYQTPRFNAKSYAETIQKQPKGQFVQHIFGGSFGGPLPNFGFGEGTPFKLLKDKAFFFVNLQLLRAYDTALVTRTVYTQSARAGLFRYIIRPAFANLPAGNSNAVIDFNGNPLYPTCPSATPPTTSQPCIWSYNIATQAPVTRDPVLMGYLNNMPLPNNFTAGDGLNTAGFSWGSPQHERQYDLTTKFDFKFNSKHSAFIRYARGDQNSFGDSANTGRPIFPDSPNFVDTFRTPRNLAVQWRWSPTATLTNEFVYGRSQYFFKFETPTPDPGLPFSFIGGIATPNTNFTYNARGVTTDQFIDNLTFIRGSHTLKGGINFRFNLHKDDRSSVAGSAIEPIVNFSITSNGGFGGYNLPVAGGGSIFAADLTTLQQAIANQIGRISTVSQAFVVDPSNPGTFAPAGTRWINKAHYSEYDFYFQDNWRVRSNLVFDLGVRWEVKAQPKIDDRSILVPDQPVKVGALPSNTLKWVEGDLFSTDFGKILPSVGFAWDPFKSGKTSIRANYRLASDRFATFLFGSSIFQSTLGNNLGATNATFGSGGGLYRNVAPIIAGLVPSQTPTQARQPASFGALSTNVIDPDLQFPQIHEWSLSFQRSIGKSNVLEVNYIGKHAVHLLGGYNVNQVNIFATDPRCGSQTFVQAWVQARDAMNTATNCLASLLTGGTSTGDSAAFRTQFQTDLTNGNVATTAQSLARSSAFITRGFSPFFFQPYPQFNSGLLVFDSNDYSRYDGLQIIGRRRMTNGLGFQIAYTLSKSKDNRSWDPSLSTVNTGNSQAGSATPFDLRDRSLNYAYSDFDRRHVIQGTYVYELPFGKGKWLAPGNSVLNYIVEGWQLAGATVYMTGRPFTVYSGRLTVGNIIQTPADCSGCTPDMAQLVLEAGTNTFFTLAQRDMFKIPAPGTIGNTGRNFFRNAPYLQTDVSLSRKFKFGERWAFDLRVDAKNVTNTPNFDYAFSNANLTLGDTRFGKVFDGVANNARRIQFSGKLSF
jgi:hypothetical protein